MANPEDIARAEAGRDVWNAWAEAELKIPEGGRANVDFSRETLEVNFSGFIFPGFCNFSTTTFSGPTDFNDAVFHNQPNFYDARFNRFANFSRVIFCESADFSAAMFGDRTDFSDARFDGWTDFSGAAFNGKAVFNGATFGELADFSNVKFTKYTNFSDGEFGGPAKFNNAMFRDATDFSGRRFAYAPLFHNATLHQDTSFSPGDALWTQFPTMGELFPDPKSLEAQADKIGQETERAYRTLKLAMSGFQAHREEMAFFALEMRARAFHEPWHRKWFYWLYDEVSQYGHSLARPLLWLAFLFPVFYIFYREFFGLRSRVPLHDAALWYVTAAHSVPLPGLFRHVDDAEKIVFGDGAHFWLGLLMGAHTLSSAVLIFLFLLAIRNRFRIR